MIKVKTLILIILTLFVFSLNATDDLDTKETKTAVFQNGLGFTAGKISGVGFNYRQYFDKNGIQFTFGLLTNADKVPTFPADGVSGSVTKTGWDVDGWVSLMYLRTLRETPRSKFYYFIGGSMNIDYSKKYTQKYEWSPSEYVWTKLGSPVKDGRNNNEYYFGPGIGIDISLGKYVSLIVELPISISSNKEIVSYVPQGSILIKF